MKTKFNYFLLLILLLVVTSCFNEPELEPSHITAKQITQEVSTHDNFKSQIQQDLNSNSGEESVRNSIHELLGKPLPEALVSFVANQGIRVGFIPVFKETSQHTEAIILAIQEPQGIRYNLLERGKLYLTNRTNNGDQRAPNPSDLANIFISYDRELFKIEDY